MKKLFLNKITLGLSVITTLFAIVGGIWAFDSHYVSANDFKGHIVINKQTPSM